MKAASEIDALLPGGAVIFGSLPPDARDLDLVLPERDAIQMTQRLRDAGWTVRGSTAARFRDCRADVVDLVPLREWGLSEAEERALIASSRPLDGFDQLRRPSPHHALLILARRVARNPDVLDDKRRRRVDDALAEQSDAWELASEAASGWDATDALGLLRRLYAGQAPPSRRRVPRPRRGTLVTFSGLDGSGKSFQAEALRDALHALGYDAEVAWTSLVAHPALGAVGEPVKRLVRRLRRGGQAAPPEEWAQPASVKSSDPARALRQQSGALTQLWATYVALVNAWWQSRATRPQLMRGRVVICDRWTLDSKVQMRYQYGSERSFGFQARLVRILSPRPTKSFLLQISPEEAVRRKPEYTLEQNELRARLYAEDHDGLGVARLDGERPKAELCALVAAEVWAALER